MLHIEVRVESKINPEWSDWFNEFTLSFPEENETVISGEVADQAALYGLLGKLRDLGLKLVSIRTSGRGIETED